MYPIIFGQRIWRKVLTSAGVEYRPPYTIRHTTISHGIEYLGWTGHQAAQMAGHSTPRMVNETYGHALNSVRLPEF
ncbi:MAG: hypothetical protein AB4042_11650 [Leptolyngbyaceae cyanobacterium]